jgi:hypothetical protein
MPANPREMRYNSPMTSPLSVYLEIGTTRVFAGALDWPGWCRSAKGEAGALEALLSYGPRYADVLLGRPGEGGRPDFVPPSDISALRVAERLAGGATTDFGAPGKAPAADEADLGPSDVERQAGILWACWAALDAAAAAAEGITLRTGPRGGGRDLDKIRGHVLEAEQAYIGQLGSRPPKGDGSPAHVAATRIAAIEALTARALGRPIPNPRQTKTLWTPRYFVRRAAWHVLDHAWEIEDRAMPA